MSSAKWQQYRPYQHKSAGRAVFIDATEIH